MKKKLSLLSFILLLSQVHLYAGSRYCSRQGKGVAAKTTLADAGEGDYDIKHLRFNLQVTDTALYMQGYVTTTAQVVVAAMNTYVFELDTLMTIDSVKINGTRLPVTTTLGYLRKVAFHSPMYLGAMFTAQVYYHGAAPAGSGYFNGVTHSTTAHGTHVMYTQSDPWVARVWWPVKQSVNDKIDSVDMFITTPNGVKDGSCGVLVNVDSTSLPGFTTYHWQTHYPITYYLISLAVARYTEDKYYWPIAGSSDSVLIHNFFLDTATFYPAFKSNFDSVGMIMDHFNSLFGRYPFWKEKYGMCYTTLPGGMEHQTMTTIGVPNISVIAHELAHQWFGDNVSYAEWGDVWLSEGFATFSEQLFADRFHGPAAARTVRSQTISRVTNDPCGMLYVNDTSRADSLFDGRRVYAKGAGVVTMLRYLAPHDSLFFTGLRTYQQLYGNGHARTSDMKAIMEHYYGMNLDTFFNQWIYGRGYPVYTTTWNQKGSKVIVKLVQAQSCPAHTGHFTTPIEVQLRTASGDTTIRLYNTADTQLFTFTWFPAVTSVVLNPNAITVCKQNGNVRKDTSLVALTGNMLKRSELKVFPNPSKNHWQIDQLPEETALVLTDNNGRTVWQGTSSKGSTTIPGERLPTGNYFLKMTDNSGSESIQLVRW